MSILGGQWVLFAHVATSEEDVSPTRLYEMSGRLVGRAPSANNSEELPLGVPAEAAGFFEGRLLANAHAAGFFHQKNLEVP